MKVWTLLLILFNLKAYSSEFTHIKLNSEFREYLTSQKKKRNPPGQHTKIILSLSSSEMSTHQKLEAKMISSILGGSQIFPTDGEESPLMAQIRKDLENTHEQIGLEEVQNLRSLNEQFNLGEKTFSGFSWQRPFGAIQVQADRQLSPNLFGDNWLIKDTFTFNIEATTFLEKLQDAGLTQMTPQEIGAFAGITFKRTYTYWHFESSYENGLDADFSKLFLPFIAFNAQGMGKMHDQEIIKREDFWSGRTGGLVSATLPSHLSVSAGVLAQYEFQNSSSIEYNETAPYQFNLEINSKKSKSIGASLELQLDFFKLIKLSLLRFELEYEFASEKEYSLGISQNEFLKIKNDENKRKELRTILKGKNLPLSFTPLITQSNESSSAGTSRKGNILLWGKMQKQKTEQVKVIKGDETKVFFKSYAQNIKVVQNIFSRIFSSVVYKLFKFPTGIKNSSIYSRQIQIEYEASHPQSMDADILRVQHIDDFSFLLTQYYNASRTDRWVDRKFKKDVLSFIENYTTLSLSYMQDIRNEILKGPLLVESTLRVEKAGLKHLINSSEDNIFFNLAKVCGSKRAMDWARVSIRNKFLRKMQVGKEACVKKLGKTFLDFKFDYLNHNEAPSLSKFKKFISRYYKKSTGLREIVALFGEENVFINGRLSAQTGLGQPYSTNFSSGQFRGLGVIDNFKRVTGSRNPASIIGD